MATGYQPASLGGLPRQYGQPRYLGTGIAPVQQGNLYGGTNRAYLLAMRNREQRLKDTALKNSQYDAEMARLDALLKRYQAYDPNAFGKSMSGLFASLGGEGQAAGGTATRQRPQLATPVAQAPQLNYNPNIANTVKSVLSMIPAAPTATAMPTTDPLKYYGDIKEAMPSGDISKLSEDLYAPVKSELERNRDEAIRAMSGSLAARGWGGGGTYAAETGRISDEAARSMSDARATAAATATQMGMDYGLEQMKMALGASESEANRALQDVLSQRGMDLAQWQTMAQIAATTADTAQKQQLEIQLKNIDVAAAQTLANQQAQLETGRTQLGYAQLENELQKIRLQGATDQELALIKFYLEAMLSMASQEI